MLVIGSFEYSIELEEALKVLEHKGILRKSILVIPMDASPTEDTQYIGKSRDRYNKGIEIGMSFATAFAVVGMSRGLALKWGPVFWSLIFAFAGFFISFGIYLYLNKNTHRHLPKKLPDVTVIVQCSEEKSTMVMETMWEYRALTVGHVPESNKE
ncbi:MAG TPA: hypothetical protein VF941_06575 [Clostridia bacterium]